MDKIREMLDRLSDLTGDELSSLEEQIIKEFETVEAQDVTSETVSAMSELADAVDAVRAEASRRAEQARELAERKEELAARVKHEKMEDEDGDVVDIEKNDDGSIEVDAKVGPASDQEDMAPEDEEEDKGKKKPFAADESEVVELDETPAPENASELSETVAETTDEPKAELAAEEAETVDTTVEAADEAPAEAEAAVEESESEDELASDEDESAEDAPASEAEASVEDEADDEVAASAETTPDAELSETPSTSPEETVSDTTSGGGTLSVREPDPQIQVPEANQPVGLVASANMYAAADIPGVQSGSEISSMLDVAELMVKRMRSFNRAGGDGEQVVVASIQYDIPEDRMLDGDLSDNRAKLDKVVSPEAVVAAGFCAPLEIRYDFNCPVGTTAEPVRDSLPIFGASRGGVRIFNDPVVDPSCGYGKIWQNDAGDVVVSSFTKDGELNYPDGLELGSQNAATGNPIVQGGVVVKPCCEFNCTDATEHYIEAVSQCFCFNNFTERFHPELIARNAELSLVQYARMREMILLGELDKSIGTFLQYKPAGTAGAGTYDAKYGALRDILTALDVAAMQYREVNRYDKDFPLRVILPEGALTAMRASALNAVDGDFSLTDAEITAFLRDRNLNVTWTLDDLVLTKAFAKPPAAPTALDVTTPVEIKARMFAEGTFALMDGGTLDLGVIRDSGLVGQNKYCTFTESFQALVKLGCDALGVSIKTSLCGAASALATC